MYINNMLKFFCIFVFLTSFLQATDLNELRSILGDESAIEKEKDMQVEQENITENNDDEKNSSESNIVYNLLLDAPADSYTINITTIDGMDAAKNYLINNKCDISNFYLYRFGQEMKSIKIIYGVFKSVDEANEALKKLPEVIIKNKPFIDNIKKHQKLFLKYN